MKKTEMNRLKNIAEAKSFELLGTAKQKKIRDRIVSEAKELNIPPSEHEYNLIKAGKLKSDWL